MSLSEFRYSRRKKHFSYIFGAKGNKRKHILLSSKSTRKKKRNGKYYEKNNVKLFKHPNPNKNDPSYVIPKIYYDDISSFDDVKSTWQFDKNDKRKIKRIKKGKWK